MLPCAPHDTRQGLPGRPPASDEGLLQAGPVPTEKSGGKAAKFIGGPV